MTTNTLASLPPVVPEPAVSLGSFLRDRRARLQPEAAARGRRRTPGLRREEVAARAAVSVTWYTWLEQGRGGAPSEEVLERLARALELDAAGREMLFLLAQQRPPPLTPARAASVPSALQHVLDAMPLSPALVKTPAWDVVAWNRAATAVLTDYGKVMPNERNTLRRLVLDATHRDRLPDWEDNVRFAIGVFRVDVARAGGSPEADALIAELLAASEDFRRLWAENDVRHHGTGRKRFLHPEVGAVTFETAAFAVEGADGLTMIVFTPATAEDAVKVEALVDGEPE
ncbi:helix-turn-helix transcriptional regulator [Solimonas marina]|uniref:Helix-turn-helix domain-containing protein n=1 Tax=Solimonas marina TaxID=2714601 RepID=A0A970B5U9_9GAMM|nr:helix-turn-helix transcriptional regulator [Solimonas marina]NKF22103.1 helix-turn-helix domain-containing protein [Solimonas marina]